MSEAEGEGEKRNEKKGKRRREKNVRRRRSYSRGKFVWEGRKRREDDHAATRS